MPKLVNLLLLPVLLVGVILLQLWPVPWTSGILTVLFAVTFGLYLHERWRRNRAEKNMRIYRETFEDNSVGIAHVNREGRWLRLNLRFTELLGYSADELSQKTFQEVTHPDDLQEDIELARQVWEREIPSYTLEKRYLRKDGTHVWVLLSVSLSIDPKGEPQYFIASVKDITARIEAERALKDSALRLRLATEAAQIGIWEYDLATGKSRGCERQWEMMGFDRLVDDPVCFDFLERIHKDDRTIVQTAFQKAIAEISDYRCEYRFENGKGEKIWLESIGSPDLDAGGKVVRMVGVNLDITSRKLAQLDFQRSVDVSPAILWITEINGDCSYLSQQWYSFTGQSKIDALGFGWLDAVHEDDRDNARQVFLAANAKRSPFYVEYRLRTAQGEYRWVIDSGNARFDTEGLFLGYAGAIFDIHDKKKVQAQLEDTAQQFKALANSIPQLAWIIDPNGLGLWYNERWLQYTGLPMEEVAGEGWKKVHHPDHLERVIKKFEACLESGAVWEDTFPIRSGEGTWRWFLSRAYPICNEHGKIERWFGTNTDITELRDFQEALTESETRFRELANSMPQLVWTANAEGKIEYYNERSKEYAGFGLFPDGSWNWQPGVHEDDREATVEAWRLAVEQRAIYSCEHRFLMADGSSCWHLSRAIPVFQSDGQVKRWYGTGTNIHDYKLALVELAKAKEIAEEANKAKSRFLANMSHEIRSPMSSVLGYADLLLEKGIPETDRLAYASSIKASGSHLLAIIDDILDLSAVESGEFKIDRHPFAVLDLIAETVQSMSVLAQRKGLNLELQYETQVPNLIESDPVRLRQILLNLLSNAIKFTDRGQIYVRMSCHNKELHIEVEDSGLGIDAQKADKLFKAFSQVDSSINRRFGGTGLGLHLSQRLAQALGGDLVLKWSAPGRGSSFLLQMGIGNLTEIEFVQSYQDSRPSKAHSEARAVRTSRKCHVLLAEDSIDNQMLIKIFLKKFGASVDIAGNGEEALRFAMTGHYDVVLMDMMMPVMDGLEATRRLRSAGFRKPIVALTAHALKEEVEKSIAAGCDLHLSKPLQMEVLSRTLNAILNGQMNRLQRDSESAVWH